MSEEDILEDLTITNRSHIIVERKVSFDAALKKWTWSKPRVLKYKRSKASEYVELIKKLVCISSGDFQTRIQSQEPKSEVQEHKWDSGIDSLTTFSDCTVKTEFWEPPKLEIGQSYLVPTGKNRWSLAKLTYMDPQGPLQLVDAWSFAPVWATCKTIAQENIPDCNLHVGTRVVALFKKILCTGEVGKGRRVHELGVVAEFPMSENTYRYLIIFDGGFWCYVSPNEVWPVFYQSKEIWDILPDTSESIVKEFLQGFYVRMIEYERLEPVKCLNSKIFDGCVNGKTGAVITTDCSLVLIFFDSLSTSAWFHRGSPHLVKT